MGEYNPGKKGYAVIGIAMFFIMFFCLWAYVYSMNQVGLPN